MRKDMRGNIRQQLEGFYKVAVVDKQGNVIWEMPEFKKNLILNQGMDMVATVNLAELFRYAVAGTGTRPNSISSGATEASQSGTTVTATDTSIAFLTNAAVGDVIKWANGTTATITVITSDSQVTVSENQSVAQDTFTIWKTAQVGLQSEIKRAGSGVAGTSYLTGTGNCGTTDVSNTRQMRRTFDFAIETSPQSYTEVGVSNSSVSNAANVFSRILLTDPVPIGVDQRLRVIYQLNITFTPSTPQSKTASISGWTSTTGVEQIQVLLSSTVGTDGVTSTSLTALDPSSSALSTGTCIWASINSTAPSSVGTAVNRTGAAGTNAYAVATKASYVSGSYYVDKTGTLAVADIPRNDIRSFGIGSYNPPTYFPYNAEGQCLVFVLDNPQTKANTQTLSLTYRFSWSRTLA